MAGIMTEAQAEHLIGNLTKKHRLFKLIGYKCNPDGVFITFEQIDLDMRTIYNWIEGEGYYPLSIGSEGSGDRRVMCATIRS